MKKNKILVCDPTFYKIDYEINPWMKLEQKVDEELAREQWFNLISILEKLNVEVLKVPPITGLPDMVFTANAGILLQKKTVLLANFKHKERIPEKNYYKEWFVDNGYETFELPEDINFEGAGDCLLSKDKYIFMGSGFRSDSASYENDIWDELLNSSFKSIKLRLIDPYFYHLDTCFCPLKDKQILLYPKAFEEEDINFLRNKFDLLEVPQEDASKFACNSVLIDKDIIMPSGCDKTKKILLDRGYQVHETDVSEFIKAGGACKCLTMVV